MKSDYTFDYVVMWFSLKKILFFIISWLETFILTATLEIHIPIKYIPINKMLTFYYSIFK